MPLKPPTTRDLVARSEGQCQRLVAESEINLPIELDGSRAPNRSDREVRTSAA
jgi:hypothetical protein